MNLILANIDPNIAFQFSGLPLLSLINQIKITSFTKIMLTEVPVQLHKRQDSAKEDYRSQHSSKT